MKLKLKQIIVAPGGLCGLDTEGVVWVYRESPIAHWEPLNMEVPDA